MNNTIFRRHRSSLSIMLALASSAGLQVAHAGSGWGDSQDPTGAPMKVPTYYANSPSGILPAADCFSIAPPNSGQFDTTITVKSQPSAGKTVAGDPLCDSGTALRKFVDTLPGLNTANNLGNAIPVAVPDTTTYPGSDYYEIGVVEYTQQMHSDLAKATSLRGYVQVVSTATDHSQVTPTATGGTQYTVPQAGGGSITVTTVAKPSYLGPVINPTSGRPVRIKFYNLLPAAVSGAGAGNLHLPVDETITGAGLGPDGATKYQQNRVEIHLHGGDNPWISDGTPHQWILPAADELALKASKPGLGMDRGVGAKNVPDMPNPGPGAMTYYFPNNQSGRLMFYHDHSLGITRLNVYAGVAAAYLINDAAGVGENDPNLVKLLPTTQIPLVIQDKTFVPKNVAMQDAKWSTAVGQEGDLWYPHVYETNQNPNSFDGTNSVGRWDWGSWFWPVYPSTYGLPTGEMGVANTPAPVTSNVLLSNVSTTPEAYMDTAVVNGTAYPSLTVEPKSYRLRILNAANDRFMNLGLYVAADKQTTNAASPTSSAATVLCDGSARPDGTFPIQATVQPSQASDCTEVKMVNFDASYQTTTKVSPNGNTSFPATGGVVGTGWGALVAGMFPQGAPDPATAGPNFVQIGNEGGLLAQPLDIPSTPLNYEYNKRSVTVLNVQERGLYLGPAERADVLVDFSKYAGQTLIMYNDAPAPNPASDPRIDYFTGAPDSTGVGGAPTTLPGYGPNTRTVMQIVVGTAVTTASPAVDVTALSTALPQAFASSQPKPIIPEPEYNAAYPTATNPNYSAPVGRNNARIYTGVVYQGTSATPNPAYQGVNFVASEDINYFPAPVCKTAALCATAVAAQQANPQVPAGAPATTTVVPNGKGLVHAVAGTPVSVYVPNKAIQELFDPAYARMNATLGIELPFTSQLTQTTIPLGYVDPITEVVADGETQIWKITHNGVDAHPVHFHLVNVQVMNRIGWDGTVKAVPGDEFGWKDTVKMNPLEDVVVAVRAKKPILRGNTADVAGNTIIPSNAFGLPISQRMSDPSQPVGSLIGFTQVDPVTGNPATVANALQTFGWEYVWHCHILGHEENDFMRPVKFDVTEAVPAIPTGLAVTAGTTGGVKLTWVDTATTEYAYKVERGITTTTGTGRNAKTTTTWTDLTALVTPAQQVIGAAPLANANTFTDTTASTTAGTVYSYRVTAVGASGNGVTSAITYTVPAPVPVAAPASAPTAPTIGTIQRTSATQATLTWTDMSTNEKTFQVQVSNDGGATWASAAGTGVTVTRATTAAATPVNAPLSATVTVANTTNASYRVLVTGIATAPAVGLTATSGVVTLNDIVAPAAATGLTGKRTGTGFLSSVALAWTDVANNNASYTVQRSTNGTTWTNLSTTLAGNATTYNALLNQPANATYRVVAVNSVGSSAPITVLVP